MRSRESNASLTTGCSRTMCGACNGRTAPSVPTGIFPQYSKHVGDKRVVVAAADVPPETGLLTQGIRAGRRGAPYTSPTFGAWTNPGPARGPFTVDLADGSRVTYYWYRFVDQPSFQQYNWSAEKKAELQAFVEKIHAQWPIAIATTWRRPRVASSSVSIRPCW